MKKLKLKKLSEFSARQKLTQEDLRKVVGGSSNGAPTWVTLMETQTGPEYGDTFLDGDNDRLQDES
ncbi:hypothetical protein [Sphingobacterium deserti]|uniref:Uncharacterized protein n=1 Tax=Sphingobacterium deserti TaxID=1229276 RepID=A0A0B8SZA6_9SPHI|nr:hypothetical protein [Sphingobacterium deserti]KGE12741.1 hypothetical protein DI53_3480 [Sphingobacterium deserti]